MKYKCDQCFPKDPCILTFVGGFDFEPNRCPWSCGKHKVKWSRVYVIDKKEILLQYGADCVGDMMRYNTSHNMGEVSKWLLEEMLSNRRPDE
jgi:hypothetical protein